MERIFIAIGLIALGLASIFYLRPKLLGSSLEIQYIKTTSIADLLSMFSQMKESGMGEDYRQYVELKGFAVTQAPIAAPFSNQAVAYYDARLLHVTEHVERYRDSKNVLRERVHKKEEPVSSEKSAETVYLKDRSGSETVALGIGSTGLKLDIPTTFNRFESKNNLGAYSYFRTYSWNRHDAASLGYKMVEKTIKQNQPLYVIGEAFLSGGEIFIGKPMDAKKPFIISTKHEEELINSSKKNAAFALCGGIAASMIGAILLLMNIF